MSPSLETRPDPRLYIHDGNVRTILIGICRQALASDTPVVLDKSVPVAWASRPGGPVDTTIQLGPGSRIGKIHSCDPGAHAFRFVTETGQEFTVHADNGRMWVVVR